MEKLSWTSVCVPRCDILPSFIHSDFLLFLCDLTLNAAEVGSAHTAYCSFTAEGSVSIHPLSEFGWEVGESLPFWVADVGLLLSHSSQK